MNRIDKNVGHSSWTISRRIRGERPNPLDSDSFSMRSPSVLSAEYTVLHTLNRYGLSIYCVIQFPLRVPSYSKVIVPNVFVVHFDVAFFGSIAFLEFALFELLVLLCSVCFRRFLRFLLFCDWFKSRIPSILDTFPYSTLSLSPSYQTIACWSSVNKSRSVSFPSSLCVSFRLRV